MRPARGARKATEDLRGKPDLGVEQAGRAPDVTDATIRRTEKAEIGLKLPYIEKLLITYGITSPEEIGGCLAPAREVNRPGRWHSFRDVLPDSSAVPTATSGTTCPRSSKPRPDVVASSARTEHESDPQWEVFILKLQVTGLV